MDAVILWLLLGAVALALLGGLGFGAWRAAQDPRFYAAIIALVWDKLGPELAKAIAKDFSPEWAEKVKREIRLDIERTASGREREH
jgi:hypothetical protein